MLVAQLKEIEHIVEIDIIIAEGYSVVAARCTTATPI